MKGIPVRRLTALLVTAGVLASLTACSHSGSPTLPAVPAGCDDAVTSGNASDSITARSAFGSAPAVDFPTPLITDRVEATTLVDGSSGPLREGQPVILEATILSGADQSELQVTAYSDEGGSLYTIGSTALPELGEALVCAQLGSRVAVVTPPTADQPDSVVFVVDLLSAFPSRATGASQLVTESGLPAVVLAPDGRPGITVPNEEAPTDYRETVLKMGDGDEITDADRVVVKYTAVNWDTKSVTSDSTWETGNAAIFDLTGGGVSGGLKEALDGQTIGSQLLAVIPSDLASTEAAPVSGTLVYVIDILGVIQ